VERRNTSSSVPYPPKPRLVYFTEKFATDTKRVSLISSDDSLGSREDIDTNSISRLADILRSDIDTLTRSANATKWWNVFGLANILECDDKATSLLREWVVSNMTIFLEDTEDLSFHLGIWNRDFVETSEVSISDTGEEICYWIVSHKFMNLEFRMEDGEWRTNQE
jgi:hypothetical protein